MSKRTEAGWRVIALLWAWTVGWVIMVVVSMVGLILGLIDIILQGITGWDVISRNGFTFTAVAESLMWMARLQAFAFTGRGDLEWFPSV